MDIIEIERVEKAACKAAFLQRIFSEEELRLYRERGGSASVLAGCFAGKEAVAKALGTGFSGFGPTDIEILRRETGAPYAVLKGGALERFAVMGGANIHLSLTNTRECAAAFAVLES